MSERQEPTADCEDWPATMDLPEPARRTGRHIAPEPEPHGESDQVCVSATLCITEGVLVEFEGMEGSHAHNPTVMEMYCMDLGSSQQPYHPVALGWLPTEVKQE